MVLETERLILRPWRAIDAPELYQHAKNPEIGPMCGWLPHINLDNSLEIIEGILSEPETYAVVLKSTVLPVGSVGLMFGEKGSIPMKDGEVEIGYWIAEPYWGQGLIPEAVMEMERHCFEDIGCRIMWCGYYDGNEKSKRVQEKCGFRYDHTTEAVPCLMGDFRTQHFTRLSRENWENGSL